MICEKCGKYFSSSIRIDGKKHNLSSRYKCLECSPFKEKFNRKKEKQHKPKIAWNRGLTKKDDVRVQKMAEAMSVSMINKIKNVGGFGCTSKEYHNSDKFKSICAKGGGYKEGSGRGKRGRYKGYWCDSSWELAYVIYNLEHNIPFKRNTEGFEYEFEGKIRKYYPDFILENGTYVEIKGYEIEITKAKIEQFPYQLEVLREDDLKDVFDYVIGKYGEDFIKLYMLG